MPEIKNTFKINSIDKTNVINLAKESLQSTGAKDIGVSELDGVTTLSTTIPSIWGWGGMNLELAISSAQENIVEVTTKGYIAQLATSPLTKKMDEFMTVLAEKLKSTYNYDLVFEKQTRFTKIPKMTFTKMDKTVFGAILVFTSIPLFIGVFSHSLELILWVAVLFGGYYFGKNYIYKNKK